MQPTRLDAIAVTRANALRIIEWRHFHLAQRYRVRLCIDVSLRVSICRSAISGFPASLGRFRALTLSRPELTRTVAPMF